MLSLADPLTTTASDTLCVFGQPYGLLTNSGFCAPFVVTPARIIHVFAAGVNGWGPSKIAALSDGTAAVQVGPELLSIDRRGQSRPLWSPSTSDGALRRIKLLGAVNNYVVGIDSRGVLAIDEGGSVAFRWAPPFDFHSGTNLIGQDRDGAIWFEKNDYPRAFIYAYLPRTGKAMRWSAFADVSSAFIGPSGLFYAATERGVIEVRELLMRSRLVRGAIVVPAQTLAHAGDDGALFQAMPVDDIGSDGSAWATGQTNVVHEHPNGEVRIIGLAPPPSWGGLGRMSLRIAPDGSAWIPAEKLVRITKNDQVQVVRLPTDAWRDFSFSNDGTVWVIAPDGGKDAVFHIAL